MRHQLGFTHAKRLLAGMIGRKILVLGDLMLDEFLWGRARRIAPEAPVPVVEIERETLHLGGAANVAANLAELGAQPFIVGVVGADTGSERLRGELEKAGIASALVTDSSRPTTIKTRIIAHSQHVVRADREKKHIVDAQVEQVVAKRFLELLPEIEVVIVSDYQKGLITPSLLQKLLPETARLGIRVCIDPKLRDFTPYTPATIITPNLHETEAAVGFAIDSSDALLRAGSILRERLGGASLLVTRGEEGMTLFDGLVTDVPAVAREVYDVTGAGDTVVATLAAALAAGAQMIEAAMLASHAAGIVVGKVGTATARPEEILASVKSYHLKWS